MELDLSNVRLAAEGGKLMVTALREITCLKKLTLVNNKIF